MAKQEPAKEDEPKKARVPEILKSSSANVTKTGTVTATEAMISGGSVIAQTAGVSMMATVSLKDGMDPDPEQIKAGWVQTVTSSKRVAVYTKGGKVVTKEIIGFSSVRDAKQGAEAPWYVPPETLTKDVRAVFPMAEDQPKAKFPARKGDAECTELQGADNFVVSLKVGGDGDLGTIQSFAWTAPWNVKVAGTGVSYGKEVAIGPAHSHPDPKNPGTANEQGNDEANKIETYETVEAAAAALASSGFQGFVQQLPKHHRLDKASYWNMVSALWKSNTQITVKLVPITGGNLTIPLAFVGDKRVDKGEVSTDGSYSALGHMVWDPAQLGPGHSIAVTVDYQAFQIPFPYSGKTFRDIKVVEEGAWDSEGTVNAIVTIG